MSGLFYYLYILYLMVFQVNVSFPQVQIPHNPETLKRDTLVLSKIHRYYTLILGKNKIHTTKLSCHFLL